jgi:Tfp pilus assembly protein PilN
MFLQTGKLNRKKEKKNAELQNPKILEVNLIKEEAVISFDWNKNLLVLILVLLLASVLVVEVYFGLNWWEKQEAAQIQVLSDQVAKLDAEAGKLKKTASAALSYKEKSAVFTDLLDNHIYWSNFFNWLEKNTLSSVHFEGFSGTVDGIYSLAATADNFADVSWQVKAFLNDPLVKNVRVVKAASAKDQAKAGRVSFTISFEVNRDIFRK